MATEVLHAEAEETLTRRRVTIEGFWSLPESVLPVEYVNGEIAMAPAPTPRRRIAVRHLSRALDGLVLRASAGEVYFSPFDFVLPARDVVQPDIFFLNNEEAPRVSPDERRQAVPSLTVEILSPGAGAHGRVTKRAVYEKNGA